MVAKSVGEAEGCLPLRATPGALVSRIASRTRLAWSFAGCYLELHGTLAPCRGCSGWESSLFYTHHASLFYSFPRAKSERLPIVWMHQYVVFLGLEQTLIWFLSPLFSIFCFSSQRKDNRRRRQWLEKSPQHGSLFTGDVFLGQTWQVRF